MNDPLYFGSIFSYPYSAPCIKWLNPVLTKFPAQMFAKLNSLIGVTLGQAMPLEYCSRLFF